MKKIFHRPRISTVLFYTALALAIAAFFYVMSGLMAKLTDYLARYQASHINTRYQEEFQRLFEEPDWAALYDQAGLTDTPFEGRDAYRAYMEEKVGDMPLQCFLESDGTLGKKCPVYCGDEQIAVFYMTCAPQESAAHWYDSIDIVSSFAASLEIQSWQMSGIELFFQREESVTVYASADSTVLVNGTALGDEHRIYTSHTQAISPDGTTIDTRRQAFRLDGLLCPPVISIVDSQGAQAPTVYDQELGCYREVIPQVTIPQEDQDAAVEAAKAYFRFMIQANFDTQLAKHFDESSRLFKTITGMDIWMIHYVDFHFSEPVVTDYYRFSEDFYSIRVRMTMYVDCRDGSVQARDLDTTFFLKLTPKGYRVVDMTNVSIVTQVQQVRLRFFVDGQMVESTMVDANARELTTPAVSVPQGKRFAGWFRETRNEDGSVSLSLVFDPGDTTIYLAADSQLQPMDLIARFE